MPVGAPRVGPPAARPMPESEIGVRRRRTCVRPLAVAVLLALATAVVASPAAAHINMLRGHLIDLVRNSDVVIVGVVTVPASLSPSGKDLEIDVVDTIRGEISESSLTAQTQARLVAGERQIIFLKRQATGFHCVQPSGTRFAATPRDDADYRRAVKAIAAALRLPEARQIQALRAALIPALQAKSKPLRYHAALDLAALSHDGHDLTSEERINVGKVRAAPGFDPALAPVIDSLLREPTTR